MLPVKLYICHTFCKASWWIFFVKGLCLTRGRGVGGPPVPPRATWYKHDTFTHTDCCDVVRNASETSLTTSLVRFLPADGCCRLCCTSFTSCNCREGRRQGYRRRRETEMFESKFDSNKRCEWIPKHAKFEMNRHKSAITTVIKTRQPQNRNQFNSRWSKYSGIWHHADW